MNNQNIDRKQGRHYPKEIRPQINVPIPMSTSASTPIPKQPPQKLQ
jgi:hypothetical protein